MELIWACSMRMQGKKYNENMANWIIKKAGEMCSYESSYLTDAASKGPHYRDACRLRVNATELTLDMVRSFKLEHLTSVYNRTLPWTQKILSSVMDKDSRSDQPAVRNANDVSI